LRREATRFVAGDGAAGFAIGGLSVGESKPLTASLLRATIAELPREKPRYLMGVGHPKDLQTYASLGVDLFDCALPTRLARNGTVWSNREGSRLDLGRGALLRREGPIAADCGCEVCEAWSLGALAALYQAREPLAYRLASIHNLALLNTVLQDLRRTVLYTP
jgi:queuine tRNA-ribosyltransferase